jgi:hypothetical protein
MAGITGAGLKAPDLLGAWSCSSCHDEVDRRTRVLEADFVRMAHLEGCLRTISELLKGGLVR